MTPCARKKHNTRGPKKQEEFTVQYTNQAQDDQHSHITICSYPLLLNVSPLISLTVHTFTPALAYFWLCDTHNPKIPQLRRMRATVKQLWGHGNGTNAVLWLHLRRQQQPLHPVPYTYVFTVRWWNHKSSDETEMIDPGSHWEVVACHVMVKTKITLNLHVTKLAREPRPPGDMWLLES